MSAAPILIVDDNALNSKLAKLLLVRNGYVVETAANAEEAIELLKTTVPRLILMDLQLPGMNGFELTRLLKQNPVLSHVPIIALTAYAMKGDEQRALETGCDGYIAKPLDTRALPKVVAAYLAGKD